MNVEPNPCFILHQRPYRETSQILDVFSRNYGRVSLIAKGAKRKKSKFAGYIQLYWRLIMTWRGKNELMTLTHIDPDIDIYVLKNHKLIAGFYLNELIVRLLHHHEAHPDLFTAYDNAMHDLVNLKSEEVVLRVFEKNLLKSLGYGLILDHDVQSGDQIEKDAQYYYLAGSGPMKKQPGSSYFIKVTGKTLTDLDNENIESGKSLRETKQLMRYILANHLGDKPLASKILYRSYVENRQ